MVIIKYLIQCNSTDLRNRPSVSNNFQYANITCHIITLQSLIFSPVVDNGLGKHAEVAGVPAVLTFYKCVYAFEIIYAFPITATKFSILLHYKRLFCVQSIGIPIYIVGSLVACWLVMKEGTAIFTCTPIQKLWDPTVVGGHCIDLRMYFIGVAVPNIFTDIALLAMPLPYIYGLNVKTLQKIAVMFVFILGGL
jgi:hypothetical protein